MKKRILFVALSLLSLASFSLQAQTRELMDKVVARVGDEYVLLSEVEEQFASAKEQRQNLPNNYKCMVVDQILVNKLLVNQAKIDSLYPKEEEIETQLNSRFERILEYMNGNVDQFVAYYGQSPEVMKETMRDDMKDQIMSEKMRTKILSDVTVTPSEVRSFFKAIPKDSLPYFNQEVEISEIILKPKPNDVQKALAKEKLAGIREQIVSGKMPFEDLAKKFSEDPGSGREGGDLGWAKRGKFVPEFEATAYKLDAGQLSEIFESEFGFHILQLIERRGNSIHTRHILVKPQITDEDVALAKHTLDSVRTSIIKDSTSFSKAVKDFGDKSTQSFHADGRVTNPASGNNTFETRDLDPDTYFAIDTMQINSICKPIEIALPTGEKYYRIIKLLLKTSPHKANLLTDYNKISSATLDQKKSTALVKWIEHKAQSTFIQVDPLYRECVNLEKWRVKSKP
ncbi:MAG: peptidylprolyl isomerase [Saprospiraceae bacterium]|nr:peptidylprolyl isomerase [Saprospiraceae bacterium]